MNTIVPLTLPTNYTYTKILELLKATFICILFEQEYPFLHNQFLFNMLYERKQIKKPKQADIFAEENVCILKNISDIKRTPTIQYFFISDEE